MHFKRLRLAPKKCLVVLLAAWLGHSSPLAAAGSEQAENNFKMVDLTPSTMMVSNQAPDRDPFNWPTPQRLRLRQIAEAEQDIFADFILQGIIWSPSSPQAVINSQLVTIGDMVDGALVTNITHTKVSLTKNSRTHSMQFDTLDIDFGTQPRAQGNR